MVGLSVVCESRKIIMRRSKTSAQFKPSAPRRSSMQVKSPYFWNAGFGDRETPRKGVRTARPESSGRPNFRRRSIDCTYHIWDLADATEGMRNIKVIEMSDSTREGTRKTNHIFPPIPAKSFRNPRLQSAKSSARSEKSSVKKNLPNGYNLTNTTNDSSLNKTSELIVSDRSSSENFTHGLPDDSRQYSSEATSAQRLQTTFSFGNKMIDNPDPQRSPHSRATKLKASSLHSRSSEGSCNSTLFRAKLASRRRQSLPATTSAFVPTQSREFHKAIKELSRQTDDSTMGMKRSQTATSLMTLSDKVSTPASSSTPRDGLIIQSSCIRRDSLHRIEEIPVEQLGTPVFTVNEETKEECDIRDNNDMGYDESGPPAHNENPTSSAVDKNITAENGIHHKTGHDLTAAEQWYKQSDDGRNITDNRMENRTHSQIEGTEDDKKHISVLNKNTLNAINKKVPTKPDILLNNTLLIEDDDSLIDSSILGERDDDLCDADFREKRIIEWILSAETGDSVEQQVESSISPSPTNGSRETAITVIYNG